MAFYVLRLLVAYTSTDTRSMTGRECLFQNIYIRYAFVFRRTERDCFVHVNHLLVRLRPVERVHISRSTLRVFGMEAVVQGTRRQ